MRCRGLGRASRTVRRGLRRGDSPVVRFALISIIPVVALGLVLSNTVSSLISDRYLNTYAASSDLTVTSAATVILSDPNLEASVRQSGPSQLSALMDGLVGITMFSPDGTVLFAEQGAPATPRRPVPAIVERAVHSGTRQAAFVRSVPSSVPLAGPALELALPVRQHGATLGVVHAYASAAQLEQNISTDTRRINLELAAGLALLWILLFPVVVSVSRRLRRQALYDSLTGLANRELFADRLAQAVAAAGRRGSKVGLVLLDLDRFKEVNDGLGHHHGDLLLSHVARALAGQVRASDTLARLGGDEFAVVLTGIEGVDQARRAAERLIAALEPPVEINGVAITPQASAGLSLYPDHGRDPEALLARADIAMYAAKSERSGVLVYEPERDFSMPARLGLVTELRRALAGDEITCYFQPLVRTADRTVEGMEALARWMHPSKGMISPAEFLPVAEQAGLMKPLTVRVLDVALGQCRAWLDEGWDLIVAVNLSARTLRDPELPDMVSSALERARVPAPNLELEITEDALLEDPVQAKAVLDTLAQRGVHIALDDFGTGYSSLAYLSQLPIEKVKIDQTFVTGMGSGGMNEKIVETVLDLGERLGMSVLAEGVETAETWQQLVLLGCAHAQGYYFARPMPAEEVPVWRAAQTPALAAAGGAPLRGGAEPAV